MEFKIFYHDIFQKHLVPDGHPEKPDRVITLNNMISKMFLKNKQKIKSRKIYSYLRKVHSEQYLNMLYKLDPMNDLIQIDPDTYFSKNTLEAAETAVSGILDAIDFVMQKEDSHSFICSRPPGHHAEPEKAMGFCIFSNAAIGAKYAVDKYKLKKVAVLDFDVHHGNGTESFFKNNNKNLVFASSHEMPLFPGTGHKNEFEYKNIINEPLDANTEGIEFLNIWTNKILPKVKKHSPEFIILSAGFDAHEDDPLAQFKLKSKDFYEITKRTLEVANKSSNNKVVSILEGGYDLNALKESTEMHLNALIEN